MLPKPQLYIQLRGISISNFHFFGAIGFLSGTALGIFLTLHQNLPLWVLCLMSLLGAIQLFVHTWIQKAITGEENLVYYRHEVGILLLCAWVLWLINQPLYPYLDISLLGVGVFLVFGRCGCYHVGCCHGKPSKIGVTYSEEHATEGFPFYYVGVRIFPLPLVESLIVLITVLVGIYIILSGYTPGTVLIWYTVFYGGMRFVLEFFRGDPERPYWEGFSEGQWTTLVLLLLAVGLVAIGDLPHYTWHSGAVIILIIAMLAITFYRKQEATLYLIKAPNHIREIAYGIQGVEKLKYEQVLNHREAFVLLANTSLGFRISCGESINETENITHYTISKQENNNSPGIPIINGTTAKIIGKLIGMLRHEGSAFQVQKGIKEGIYHVIFINSNIKQKAMNISKKINPADPRKILTMGSQL